MALALAACCLLLSPAATASQDSLRVRKKVIVDIDGGVDDFVTLLLLLSKPAEVEVIAVTILDADCIASESFSTARPFCMHAAAHAKAIGRRRGPSCPSMSHVHVLAHSPRRHYFGSSDDRAGATSEHPVHDPA